MAWRRKWAEGTVRQEEIRYAAMLKTLELLGSADRGIADELFSTYMEARLAGAKPFDDVPDALASLKNRYRLGIISNGNNAPQAVGLDDVFDFTVFAHDCGFPKPDPRIFQYALAKFGDTPRHVAHVGDSLASDVQGANQHGMLSVWLNRNAAANETGITPPPGDPWLCRVAGYLRYGRTLICISSTMGLRLTGTHSI